MQFSDLGLSPDILRAIADAGYTTPTPIQAQAVPVVLTGRDVLGCAQTGTGKTASFTLPMLEILARGRARARMPRSLILEPTRELAAQVAENFDRYGKYHKLSKALLIGGESFTDQQKALDRGVDVLIATPGRLLDLFERGKILMSDVKVLVIDEADRMLDMGFIPDVERIVSLLPKIRQTLFFSATMAPEIRRLADAFLLNPKEITVAPPASTTALVTEGMVIIDDMQKREALRRLIRAEQVKNALIFCNRKRDVDILYKSLHRHGFNAAAIHGDLAQAKRTETLEKFKQGEITLLVASDVAARGLDVIGMSHVFNFDVPIHAEDYVHRIGRTGRAGREGRAFTLATPYDGKFVEAIVKLIGREIPRIEIEGIEQLPYEEGRRRSRGGERGGRERGPERSRGRGRERGERKHAEPRRREGEGTSRHKHQNSEEQRKPVEQPAMETPQVAQAPQPQAEALAQSHAAPAKHRHERQARQERPERQERQERHRPRREAEERDDRQTVAFGDDNTPDFLRRPVKLPPVVRKAPRAA